MKQKLLTKVLVGYLIFVLFALFSLRLYTASHMKQLIQTNEANRMYDKAVSIANNYGYRFYNNSITMESLVDSLTATANFLDTDIWVVTPTGGVTAISPTDSLLPPSYIQDFDISEIFGNTYYSIGDFHSYFSEDYLSVYAPITIKYNVQGYIMLHKPCSKLGDLTHQATDISFQTAFIILLTSSVLLLFIIFLIIRPLHIICRGANEYAQENFKPQINLNTQDELSYLASVMSIMANRIDTQEESQRKFISNVSHDFKSPLTSIRGYIQAMMDGTIPVERYDKYLGIISNEADRLTQLTNNLLDLNRIGSRDSKLELGEFDINQVIIDCAQSCEGQCDRKGISLELILCEESMYVRADKPKIQQVIYNLLDNAIKFSNADSDSTIKIETSCKNTKLYVSVKDEGIGIPKESINDIWHRFYKSDLSRGKDKKGTGLGLSIVKEIIQAHNENISVISAEGEGTEFVFTLALSEEEYT